MGTVVPNIQRARWMNNRCVTSIHIPPILTNSRATAITTLQQLTQAFLWVERGDAKPNSWPIWAFPLTPRPISTNRCVTAITPSMSQTKRFIFSIKMMKKFK